jgi:gluconolactonase
MRSHLLAIAVGLVCVARAVAADVPQLPPPQGDDPAAFALLVSPQAHVEKVRAGFGFLEGTVWLPDGRLVFSDEGPGRDTLFQCSADGVVSVFRHPSHNSNGNAIDRQGRLVTCEQDTRSVTRTEPDGRTVTLADRYQGKRFNSPNDVVVKSDGTVWFTDPALGVPKGEHTELPGNWVFRVDPRTGVVTAVVTDMPTPNGLAFSPDERLLYVSDTSRARNIRAYDVRADGTVANGRVICRTDKGVPDGFRVDQAGRLWSSAGDGIHVFGPDGKRIGRIFVPESPANLCFGGRDGHTLFIAARTGLYRIAVSVTGATTRPN